MTYFWTVDKKSTLEYYIGCFTGIITNYSASVAKVLKEQGIKLATFRDIILAAVSGIMETYTRPYKYRCHYIDVACEIVEFATKVLAYRRKNSCIRSYWTRG